MTKSLVFHASKPQLLNILQKVLKIVRPTDNGLQNFVYNGHKRAHFLKFQAVTTPDGISLH